MTDRAFMSSKQLDTEPVDYFSIGARIARAQEARRKEAEINALADREDTWMDERDDAYVGAVKPEEDYE